MGWGKYSKTLDETLIPQKDDSVGDVILKAVCAPFSAAVALLDLFSPDGKSSSSRNEERGGGGCHCDCERHKR